MIDKGIVWYQVPFIMLYLKEESRGLPKHQHVGWCIKDRRVVTGSVRREEYMIYSCVHAG